MLNASRGKSVRGSAVVRRGAPACASRRISTSRRQQPGEKSNGSVEPGASGRVRRDAVQGGLRHGREPSGPIFS